MIHKARGSGKERIEKAHRGSAAATGWGWFVGLLLLAGCYDAPRTNPFDPALTPAVELQVALDDTAGTAALTWTRYEGKQPFREYQVLRKQPGLEKVDTLTHIPAVEQLTFVDSSLAPATDYLYRVSVVNSGGFEVPSQEEEARPLSLPGVQLLAPVFDSRTATAALKWTSYKGPRFKAYRMERRSAGLVTLVVKEVADLADTTYVDSLLVGNTEYFYRVVVLTTRDEEVESEEVSGKFHALVQSWPLDLEQDEYVRLYREDEGITALVAGHHKLRLLFFDTQGALLEEQMLMDNPYLDIEPHSVDTALGEEGERWLSLRYLENTDRVFLLRFDLDGQLLRREREVFADSLPLLSGPEAIVPGEISLLSSSRNAWFGEVQVSKEGQVLFAEDFESGDLSAWDYTNLALVEQGAFTSAGGLPLVKRDESWQDFRLEAEVEFRPRTVSDTPQGSITIGDVGRFKSLLYHSSFSLRLQYGRSANLRWFFDPPPGSGLRLRSENFLEPLEVLAGLSYRLALEFAEGHLRAAINTPDTETAAWEGGTPWGTLATLEGRLALIAGLKPYTTTPERALIEQPLLDAPASQLRFWTAANKSWLGLCLPQVHQVFIRQTSISRAAGRINWGGIGRPLTVGTQVGQEAGAFLYPLSFAGAPDGRIYVLDAGNARIQAFDSEGKYLTQWGHKGSGEGEFDFGSGRVPEDFAGSVAVDEEGYIYVADMGNRRIQKFAP